MDECPFLYTLSWATKQGGNIKGSLAIEDIESISLLAIHRELVYNQTKELVMLRSQILVNKEFVSDKAVDIIMKDSDVITNRDLVSTYTFLHDEKVDCFFYSIRVTTYL